MKLTLSVIVTLLSAATCFAQPRWSPEVRAKRETQWMQDSLRLTTVQVNKVSNIILTYNKEADKCASMADVQARKKKQESLIRIKKQGDEGCFKQGAVPAIHKKGKGTRAYRGAKRTKR